MKLNALQLLTLTNLVGVGNKSVLKVGNYLQENRLEIQSWADLVPILEFLKVKTKEEGVKGTVKIKEEHLLNAERIAKQIIESSEKLDIGVVTYFEDNFPAILRSTTDEAGKPAPPIVLYYKGDLSITSMPGLAIIGTREATPEGVKAGTFLASEFAKRGLSIVSGLAIGCDTCGHRGALAVGGKTVAFLAHGLDMVYPPENESLAHEIVENGGLLLSEYPIGIGVNRYNLVARDRLQAGLSNATLVIQTGVHGGTMHASIATLNSHKPLYVVYHSNDATRNHEKSLGLETLHKKGAKYIAGGDDRDKIAEDIKNYKKKKASLFD